MKYLLQKGKIGKLELKNRVIMSAIGINSLVEIDGGISERVIDFYIERAKGGVGMIISGVARIEEELEPPPEFPFSPYLRLNNRRHLPRLNTLVELLHDYDTKFFIQLTAGVGRIGSINPVAPSSVPAFSHSAVFKKPNIITRAITLEEIKRLIQDFGSAAKLAYDVGVDGVELHGHEGYLLDQFMTALWNQRNDEYGGSTENRCRLACEIIQIIKEKTIEDYPVIYQYGAEHKIPGGRELNESIKIAKILEDTGADALRIDTGCYENWHYPHPPIYQPEGLNVELAESIKRHVDIPVITMGKLGNPLLAESILKEERVDFIALGRPLLADPEWVNKVSENRIDEVRPCIGDHEGCLSRAFSRKYLSCTVNPKTGAERFLSLNVSQKPKKVFVIGGGPSGMEAARVAALGGHNVELFEKENTLGGLLNPASKPYFKKEVSLLKNYYINQMRIQGVKVNLGYDADDNYKEIVANSPDCVFVAVGAIPERLSEKSNVEIRCNKQITSAIDVLNGEEVGLNVIVLGGGLVGCETALYLKTLNKTVKIIKRKHDLVSGINWVNRTNLLELVNLNKIDVLVNTKVLEIGNDLKLESNGRTFRMEYDTLVVAIGSTPNNKIYDRLVNKVPKIYKIGDCNKPGRLLNAIWDGYRKARLI